LSATRPPARTLVLIDGTLVPNISCTAIAAMPSGQSRNSDSSKASGSASWHGDVGVERVLDILGERVGEKSCASSSATGHRGLDTISANSRWLRGHDVPTLVPPEDGDARRIAWRELRLFQAHVSTGVSPVVVC
jgi:hypothetical protein